MIVRALSLLALMLFTLSAYSQLGHPAKGSWSGKMGPDAANQGRIRLLINAGDGELSGQINPGRRAVEMTKIELDSPSWTLNIRADMLDGELVMSGKLSNLGSWTNRKYTGIYTLGDERGSFDLSLN